MINYQLKRSKSLWIHLFFLIFFLVIISVEAGRKSFVRIFFPNGYSVTAELAVTDEERELGLMFRDKINPDQGMLFIFKEEGIYSFWMKNMNFPIDILWLDRGKRIVHIEDNVPACKEMPCPSYSPQVPACYVLELKAGSVEENKLKLSDRLEFIISQGADLHNFFLQNQKKTLNIYSKRK